MTSTIAFFGIIAASALAADSDAAKALQILNANCSQCHSKAMTMSALDLSSRVDRVHHIPHALVVDVRPVVLRDDPQPVAVQARQRRQKARRER